MPTPNGMMISSCLARRTASSSALGDQILPRGRSVHQEQRTTVGMRQEAHVDQYLVTQHVDVELVGHVPYQLHEQFALVQVGQMAAVGDGAPGGRRTAFLRKRKRNTTINDTPWHSETLRQLAVSPPSSPARATHCPNCAQQIDALPNSGCGPAHRHSGGDGAKQEQNKATTLDRRHLCLIIINSSGGVLQKRKSETSFTSLMAAVVPILGASIKHQYQWHCNPQPYVWTVRFRSGDDASHCWNRSEVTDARCGDFGDLDVSPAVIDCSLATTSFGARSRNQRSMAAECSSKNAPTSSSSSSEHSESAGADRWDGDR
uniref:Uncharacterized protein n=1 Tax=Anopheles merus TaxID=30066 RepID=A0A182UMC8_ANOME